VAGNNKVTEFEKCICKDNHYSPVARQVCDSLFPASKGCFSGYDRENSPCHADRFPCFDNCLSTSALDNRPATASHEPRALHRPGHLYSCRCLIGDLDLSAAEPSQVDFTSQVRPILQAHCIECHGGVKQVADLSFVHRDAALAVIVAGQPKESLLIQRITSSEADEVMPPPEHGSPLSVTEIQTLTKWIEQSAPWQLPWAYEPPVRSEAPTVSTPAWCQQSLDRYVLARLDQEQLAPAPQAPPSQWLRRVTLDLTGVPPTPEAQRSFLQKVSNEGQTAYQTTVDQLLKSPSYGERWASVWLDQVRYADSRGLGADGRREIWKYRDWVIDAMNKDLPFDEFTIKQIAGDLLPAPTIDDLVATSVNRLTQTNEEGGTDDEEFRINAVLDRVSAA